MAVIKEPEFAIPSHWEPVDPFPEYGSVGSFIPHDSPDGRLWLRYYRDRNARSLKALAWFGPGAEGAPGRIHGGSVSAIMDEALGAAAWLRGLAVVTATLQVKYRRPLKVGTLCELDILVEKVDKRRIKVRGKLSIKDDGVIAEAEGVYFRIPDSELTDKLAKIMFERRSAKGQNTVEYMLMLAVVAAVVLAAGLALKRFMPELVAQVTAPIQKIFGGSGETASSSPSSDSASGRSLSSFLPGGGASGGSTSFGGFPGGGNSGGASRGGDTAGSRGGSGRASGPPPPMGAASLHHQAGPGGAGSQIGGGPSSQGGGFSSQAGGFSAQGGVARPGAAGDFGPSGVPGFGGIPDSPSGAVGLGASEPGMGRAGVSGTGTDLAFLASRAWGMAGSSSGGSPPSDADWDRLWSRLRPADIRPPSDGVRAKTFESLLMSDRELQAAGRDWGGLSREERLKALQSLAGLFAQAYGIEEYELTPFDAAAEKTGLAAFHRADGKMMIDAASLVDHDAAVETTIHQGLHRYQDDLIARASAGRLTRDDDRFNLVLVLGANRMHYRSSRDYRAYRAQPIERHAFSLDGVASLALGALKAGGARPGETLREAGRQMSAKGRAAGLAGLLLPCLILAALAIMTAMAVVVIRAEA